MSQEDLAIIPTYVPTLPSTGVPKISLIPDRVSRQISLFLRDTVHTAERRNGVVCVTDQMVQEILFLQTVSHELKYCEASSCHQSRRSTFTFR